MYRADDTLIFDKPDPKELTHREDLLGGLILIVTLALAAVSLFFFHKISRWNCHYDGFTVLGNILFIVILFSIAGSIMQKLSE